ncbi:MAG: helix-turn-helix domain-containing protein [Firmicutes bacterium]|nr:helix-turn-helix domain-containing protein [Bacillota bacterium]
MISNQIIQTSIEELRAITKVEIYVFDLDGMKVASTTDEIEISREIITGFAVSPADSQVVSGYHFLKVLDDSEIAYVLAAKSANDDAYMVAKIAVSQIQNLIIAYKERFDRNNFFQNLILDNLLLVDIYNRAQKLHVEVEAPRIVYLVETRMEKDNGATEMLKSLFSSQNGDYITAVDEKNIILIKAVEKDESPEALEQTANMIVDMMNSEAMMKVRVSYGTVVRELREVSKSYKEAMMAMDVGRIFYAEKNVIAYSTLGIGRLIYQLPVNLCRIFIEEIFGGNQVYDIDDETLTTINKFFENNLNVSETSRQLFIHRNTLVYRIEKLQKATGLDIRTFEDAMTFKIAMMVVNYMKYLDTLDY